MKMYHILVDDYCIYANKTCCCNNRLIQYQQFSIFQAVKQDIKFVVKSLMVFSTISVNLCDTFLNRYLPVKIIGFYFKHLNSEYILCS